MMTCPKCSGDTTVIATRNRKKGCYRRRYCVLCGERYSTIELPQADVDRLMAELDFFKGKAIEAAQRPLLGPGELK